MALDGSRQADALRPRVTQPSAGTRVVQPQDGAQVVPIASPNGGMGGARSRATAQCIAVTHPVAHQLPVKNRSVETQPPG
jgi:hypothetical protein